MTSKIEEVEYKLIASISSAKEKGWRIHSHFYINTEFKCCCPIGSLWITEAIDPKAKIKHSAALEKAAQELGITPGQVRQIVFGFDRNFDFLRTTPKSRGEWFALGLKLRTHIFSK